MIDIGVPVGRHYEHDRLIDILDVPDSLQNLLPVSDPTPSFWLDIRDDPNFDLAKSGSSGALTEDADICIIGSGSSGISAAYHISLLLKNFNRQAKVKVVLLEARDFCGYIIRVT